MFSRLNIFALFGIFLLSIVGCSSDKPPEVNNSLPIVLTQCQKDFSYIDSQELNTIVITDLATGVSQVNKIENGRFLITTDLGKYFSLDAFKKDAMGFIFGSAGFNIYEPYDSSSLDDSDEESCGNDTINILDRSASQLVPVPGGTVESFNPGIYFYISIPNAYHSVAKSVVTFKFYDSGKDIVYLEFSSVEFSDFYNPTAAHKNFKVQIKFSLDLFVD